MAERPGELRKLPDVLPRARVAHQWWGHAVGWKNYHEQWISEGFAQYFAALYAEKDLESERDAEPAAPDAAHRDRRSQTRARCYLGYRLGHIRADERVFRSIIYNKAAMVLHMLRRLVGDKAFFAGVRTFYEQWKFKKAGTDDFRVRRWSSASGRDLNRFFETWIYGTAIPTTKFSVHVTRRVRRGPVRAARRSGGRAGHRHDRIQHRRDQRKSIVPLADKVTERTLPLKGAVRSITANADNGALVEIVGEVIAGF